MTEIMIACAMIVGAYPIGERLKARKLEACVELGARASDAGRDVSLILAMSWIESAFEPKAKSKAGALGMLQILPRYFCPRRRAKGCDLIAAGFRAIDAWAALSKSRCEMLCKYNGGHVCGRRSRLYAHRVANIQRVIAPTLSAPPLSCRRRLLD